MKRLTRRNFVSLISATFGGVALTRLLPLSPSLAASLAQQNPIPPKAPVECWLDVAAPFLVEAPNQGIRSEIFLTSDTFVGRTGYTDGADATEYEIYLYDKDGKPVGQDGVAKRFVVPAMQTTRLNLADLLGDQKTFWGGMKIRLRPKGRQSMHASDLFSSAFVRWKTEDSFDNVHANPDPWEWKHPQSFFYSMPFPPLEQYECVFSLFNPNSEKSAGTITLHSEAGVKLKELPYELPPHASLLLNLRRGEFAADFAGAFLTNGSHHANKSPLLTPAGGTLAVVNQPGSTKSFGYLLIKRAGSSRFSVEHPIHQPPFKPVKVTAPFDAAGRFKPKNILFTPLVFHATRIGGVTLDSRFHISSGAPIEEFLWAKPFVSDSKGDLAWQVTTDTPLPKTISADQIERESIKLGGMQSCTFAANDLELPKIFSGGMSLAVAPTTNHTLMKVELRVKEWGAHAFTHFRPGLQSARGYQASTARGELATDYIACGARVERSGGKNVRDEIVAVINIDDKALAGHPALEVFGGGGLITRIELGEVPAYATRHYLLSELASGRIGPHDLTLRLVDERATLLMSVVHLDYVRRDLSLDHGSDRFSTFNDYGCAASA
ncbi:MAG TPA: hypothetical protein VHQ64_13335 [Pyrinomonadaceae bacterium]|jgi:hypothetical protein|nr:hypothetical protein [Pyrinomonadaceae bacterium]